jgi:hypothetical protein
MLRQKGGFNMQFETARDIGAKTPKVYHRPQTRQQRVARAALTAARLLAAGMIRSVAEAADSTGSTHLYVRHAVVVLKAEDDDLIQRVYAGQIPLPQAAKQAKRVADLIHAHRVATSSDLVKAARVLGSMLVAAE